MSGTIVCLDHDGLDLVITATERRKERSRPYDAFGNLMVAQALTPAQRTALRKGRPLRLVLRVARADLIAPVESALDRIAGETARIIVDDADAARELGFDMNGVLAASAGAPAIHVCSDLSEVSPTFLAIAEAVQEVPPPDGRMARHAVNACSRGRAPAWLDGLEFGEVPFEALCAGIPRGGKARHAIRTLLALSAKVRPADDPDAWLPPLEDCIEYGPAQAFGLRLKRDLALWKSGRLPAHDLDGSALLSAPPGIGKTFFARVLAKSLDVPMVRLGIGDMFDNDGRLHTVLAEVRKAFARAAATAPCLLFLDEIDSLPSRDGKLADPFLAAVLNELLVQLDGVGSNTAGVMVIGATNRPERIDPALVRPGRLSTLLEMGVPNHEGLMHVLRVQLRSELEDVSLDHAAVLGAGGTPAEAMQWVRSARSAARDSGTDLSISDLERAIVGEGQGGAGLYRVSVHEAGHAVTAVLLEQRLREVSVIASRNRHPRANIDAGKITETTRPELERYVMCCLAGRVAEDIVFDGCVSAGSGGDGNSDLAIASRTLAAMQASLGLSGSLLWRTSPDAVGTLMLDPSVRTRVDEDLRRLYGLTKALLTRNRHALHAVTDELVAKRALTGQEVRALIWPRASKTRGRASAMQAY